MAEEDRDKILDLPEKGRSRPQRFDLFIMLSLGIILVGLLFKIMHWPFGSELTVIGAIALTISYGLRFALSPQKSMLDLLRLVFGSALLVSIILNMTGFRYGDTLITFAMWLLLPILVLWLISYFRPNDK